MKKAVFFAVLAAALYALNAPVSKLLLRNAPPTMMAGFLYLGAGIGMSILGLVRSRNDHAKREIRLSRKDLPYTLGMIVLDIAAPIFLMIGLKQTTAANASLLNNFEIVATSLIAMLFFREKISRQLWIAIFMITLSSALLTVEDAGVFRFSTGSLFVLLAATCWGLENNCTRRLSRSDPLEIVVVKGLCSGAGSIMIGLAVGESFPVIRDILLILLLGFIAYGLSIYFYVYAQRDLGAAKTSAYYAVAPFIGVLLSLIIFREIPGIMFFIALAIMILGTWLINRDCEKENERMKFDQYAETYDAGWRGTKSARFYEDLIKELEINPGDAVLDVGCGTGTVLKFISSKAEIKGYGLDISPQMLEVARKKNPGFEFTEGNCETLPYEDASMDVIMACMAYHHFSDQEKFRREAYRVLKPNGKMYICDPRFPWIVRVFFNNCFKDAGFHTPKKNAADFAGNGFRVEKITKDLYVQVLTLRK